MITDEVKGYGPTSRQSCPQLSRRESSSDEVDAKMECHIPNLCYEEAKSLNGIIILVSNHCHWGVYIVSVVSDYPLADKD